MNEALARRYASAVYSLASEAGKTEAIGADLRGAATAILNDPDVRRFYLAPIVQRDEKSALIAKAFEGKVDPIVLHTLLLLVRKSRENYVGAIADAYEKMLMSARGTEPLEIVAARPLSKDELDAIVERVSKKYQKTFAVKYSVDPSLIGGLQISMGDRFIDGSFAGKIQELARELFSTS